VPAAAKPHVAAKEAPSAGFDTGTFWRITTPDGARAHVLGTIHLGRPDDLAVPHQAWEQLRQARRLVVELAQDTLDARQVAKLQRLPAAQSMARHLSRDEQGRLLQRLNRAGVRPAALLHFKPWVLTQWLQVGDMQPAMSLDDQVVLLARLGGVPVSSLESVQEQFAAFECIDTAEQVILLKETLATREEFFTQLNQDMLALYRNQRVGELVDQIERRFPISPSGRAIEARSTACTIARRNLRFAERLRPLLGAGDVFVAIGAAHLCGHNGVLAQLAQGGYLIERVPVDEPAAATSAVTTAATIADTRAATMPENPR
jgi:uncharacterized protein YbaP (TraB family)